MQELKSNVFDTALVLEGGGLRAAYSSAFIVQLLEQGIYFDYVTGISAGSSLTVNYLSRDIPRTRRSFVDLMGDPRSHGLSYFLRGEGFIHAYYNYEYVAQPGNPLPFDYETFRRNPARCRVTAFDLEEGRRVFRKEEMTSLTRTLEIVRASSSMPFFMPGIEIDGHRYVDGGLDGGIPLQSAQEDGFERFFIILTKPRGYVMKDMSRLSMAYIRKHYRPWPKVYEALSRRADNYNRTMEECRQLEKEGKALIVYSEDVTTSNMETRVDRLKESYDKGYRQSQREVSRWLDFLGDSLKK